MDKFEVRVSSVSGSPDTHVLHTEVIDATRADVAVSKVLKKLGTRKSTLNGGTVYKAPLKLAKGHIATVIVKAL